MNFKSEDSSVTIESIDDTGRIFQRHQLRISGNDSILIRKPVSFSTDEVTGDRIIDCDSFFEAISLINPGLIINVIPYERHDVGYDFNKLLIAVKTYLISLDSDFFSSYYNPKKAYYKKPDGPVDIKIGDQTIHYYIDILFERSWKQRLVKDEGMLFALHPVRLSLLGSNNYERIIGLFHDFNKVHDNPLSFLEGKKISYIVLEALRILYQYSDRPIDEKTKGVLDSHNRFAAKVLSNDISLHLRQLEANDNVDSFEDICQHRKALKAMKLAGY